MVELIKIKIVCGKVIFDVFYEVLFVLDVMVG